MRALQFAQDRLATGGSRSIRRPVLLTILMWVCGVCAICVALSIAAVSAGFAPTFAGGMEPSEEHWPAGAVPLITAVAVLIGLTSLGLRRHAPWARWTCLCIWPLIIAAAVAEASSGAIPWRLARHAMIDSGLAWAVTAWLLFRSRSSVLYFYRIRQARGGSILRR